MNHPEGQRTWMTRGSEGVEEEIDLEKVRSSALMMTGSGMIEEESLSEEVSTSSLWERALARPI